MLVLGGDVALPDPRHARQPETRHDLALVIRLALTGVRQTGEPDRHPGALGGVDREMWRFRRRKTADERHVVTRLRDERELRGVDAVVHDVDVGQGVLALPLPLADRDVLDVGVAAVEARQLADAIVMQRVHERRPNEPRQRQRGRLVRVDDVEGVGGDLGTAPGDVVQLRHRLDRPDRFPVEPAKVRGRP